MAAQVELVQVPAAGLRRAPGACLEIHDADRADAQLVIVGLEQRLDLHGVHAGELLGEREDVAHRDLPLAGSEVAEAPGEVGGRVDAGELVFGHRLADFSPPAGWIRSSRPRCPPGSRPGAGADTLRMMHPSRPGESPTPDAPAVISPTHEPLEGRLERMGLTALGYPPFVTFFLANLTSNASWFIFGAALNTYILAVTGSAQTVGIASFVYSLPFALFMLHAGLMADRFGSKRMVVLSLAGAGAAIVATGLLALAGWPLWVLVALGCVMSTFQTLGAPAFISIVNDLVPPRAISSGVALTFLGFNVGRIVGGIIGGILLAVLGTDIVTAAALTIIVAGVMQSVPSLPISRLRVHETHGANDGPLDDAPVDRGRLLCAPLPDARPDHPGRRWRREPSACRTRSCSRSSSVTSAPTRGRSACCMSAAGSVVSSPAWRPNR